MGFIRWVFALAVLSVWCALIGTTLYVALYSAGTEPVTGDVIVVLGGDLSDPDVLNDLTTQRVNAAVGLFNEGAAPLMVMTGGDGVGETMRAAAQGAGVPETAILVEGASRSTLQNALFTADLERIDLDGIVLLVTQTYHLPRANASFRWAGFSDVRNVAANPDSGFELTKDLMWEAVKWPLNVLRAAAASAAKAGNVPRENYIEYLE
ncbi:unnamed protein product [Ectocarpus sp. 12 AP-2014]